MVAAVEQWRLRDHAAEWAEWERCLAVIETAAFEAVATHGDESVTMTSSRFMPGKSNVTPMLDLRWQPKQGSKIIPPDELIERLSAGFPRIEVVPLTAGGDDTSTVRYPDGSAKSKCTTVGVRVNPYMMQVGEEIIVAEKLRVLLSKVEEKACARM